METANKSIIIFAFTLAAALLTAKGAAFANNHVNATAEETSGGQNVIRKVVGSEVTHVLVNEKNLGQNVGFLSDTLCEGRATGSRGAVETAAWIERQFRRIGIVPFGDNYTSSFLVHDGRIGRNVIGLLPTGGRKVAKPYIVVMAHYDGPGTLDGVMYPGADSNASGVAAMLGNAEMLAAMMRYGRIYGRNIIFAATDGKGLSMRGAHELWNTISGGGLRDPFSGQTITADDIKLVVNIDQIGSTLAPLTSGRKDYMIMLSGDRYLNERSMLTAMNNKYGLGMELAFDYYGSKGFTELFYNKVSEQKVFLEHGKPAVMFTSGITMNNNKTWDKVENLDLEVLKKRIWLIFHWMERIL